MKKTKTQRGFDLIEFKDGYGFECSLQESSAASEPFIWFGVDDAKPVIGPPWKPYPIPENVSLATRMHLNRKQVKALLPHLIKFVKEGCL